MGWWTDCGCGGCTVTQCTGTVPATIDVEISGVTGFAGCDDSAEINGTHTLAECRRIVSPYGCLLVYGKTLTSIKFQEPFGACTVPLTSALLGCRIWFDFGIGADNDLSPYDVTATSCSGVWGYSGYSGTIHDNAFQIASGEIAVDFMIPSGGNLRVVNTYYGNAGSTACSDKLNMSLSFGGVSHNVDASAYNWSGWTVAVSS